MGLNKCLFVLKEKGFQGSFKRTDKGRTTDRYRELVPGNWILVRERALAIRFCSEGWDSEYSGVCIRAELQERSVKTNCS